MHKLLLALAATSFAVMLVMPVQAETRMKPAGLINTGTVQTTEVSSQRRYHRRYYGPRRVYWGPRRVYWGPRRVYWGPRRAYWAPRRAYWGPRYAWRPRPVYWGPRYYWRPRPVISVGFGFGPRWGFGPGWGW